MASTRPEEKAIEEAAIDLAEKMDSDHVRIIMEALESIPEPTRPKRKRKRRLPTSTSPPKEKKPRTGGTKKSKPPWMQSLASLIDLVPIIALSKKQNEDEEGTSIYFDVQGEDAPYNTYTPKVIRHLAKKVREYPQLSLKWNTLGCKYGESIIEIPLNGRHASRNAGDSLARGHLAFQAFKQLGCESKPSNSFMKDLGYGAGRAAELISLWCPDEENHLPTKRLDDPVLEDHHTHPDTPDQKQDDTEMEVESESQWEHEEISQSSSSDDDLPPIPPVLKRTKRQCPGSPKKKKKKKKKTKSAKKD